MDKNAQAVIKVFQGIISASADENAGTFAGNVFNGVKGSQKYFVVQRKIKGIGVISKLSKISSQIPLSFAATFNNSPS